MRGETKKGGRWSFPGRSFQTICKQSQLLWKRAPIRETARPIQWGSGKNIGVITLMRLVAVLITDKPGVGLVDKFDSGREKRVLAYDNLLIG